MTAKEYLRQIRDLEEKAKDFKRYYEICEREIPTLRSPKLDSTKVQGNGKRFMAQAERLIDSEAKARETIDALTETRERIIWEIESLNYPYSSILFKRYVEYKDFDAIADEMQYSYSMITHAHGEALRLFSLMIAANE